MSYKGGSNSLDSVGQSRDPNRWHSSGWPIKAMHGTGSQDHVKKLREVKSVLHSAVQAHKVGTIRVNKRHLDADP